MSFSPFRLIRGTFSLIWRMLDATRRALLNLVLLVLIVMLVVSFFGSGNKRLDEKTALVLDLKGPLVEQRSGKTSDTVLNEAMGDAQKFAQLRDVLAVIDSAAKDSKINSIVLILDDMEAGGMPVLHEVAAAIDRFKASGKKVVAWSASYDQRQYYLASHADELYLHPMGNIQITGFGHARSYYHDALDKLGVTVNLMRVGTYKSFAEPFIANGPSQAATEAENYLYGAMWKDYTDDIEKARKLPAGTVMQMINNLPQLMTENGGDYAKILLNAKLVDALKTRDELRQLMIARGARDDQEKTFRQVNFEDYLALQKPKLPGDGVGVVVAQGEITDGVAPAGAIGGLSTASLIRKAREDDHIKAIVLRVNSPGGSAFGAELIRRELELTRAAGKPVVISMGDVAASGGYWISMSSDEVIADRDTITGSIGVFSILPTFEKTMDKIGVHTAGESTTWLGNAYHPLRPIDPRFTEVIQASVNHIYADFTGKAAQARKTTPQKIDEVAQGRVWTGTQAKERGLIDRIGSYNDALQAAATRAKLDKDFNVSYIEREPSKIERLVNIFGGSAKAAIAEQIRANFMPAAIPATEAKQMLNQLAWLNDITNGQKPFTAITHCLCTQP